MRILRRQIANQRNVPPFIIFGDVSLREMVCYLPKTNEEFLNIKGVGQQKLKDFGDLFLETIKSYLKEKKQNNSFLDCNKEENSLETDYHKRVLF